jgi:type 1 fimbria pilin
MKKLSIAVAIMLGMACSGAQAVGELGQLIFNGKISSSACTIDAAGTTSSIVYDTLSAANISYPVYKTAHALKPMTIKLVNCPVGLPIKVKFEGSYDEPMKLFKDSSGKNIGVAIYNRDSLDKIDGDKFVTKKTSASGDNLLDYDVVLGKWKNAVAEPGNYAIAINYTMSYE